MDLSITFAFTSIATSLLVGLLGRFSFRFAVQEIVVFQGCLCMQSEMIGIFERCCIFFLLGLIMANLASLLIFISWHSSSVTACHLKE